MRVRKVVAVSSRQTCIARRRATCRPPRSLDCPSHAEPPLHPMGAALRAPRAAGAAAAGAAAPRDRAGGARRAAAGRGAAAVVARAGAPARAQPQHGDLGVPAADRRGLPRIAPAQRRLRRAPRLAVGARRGGAVRGFGSRPDVVRWRFSRYRPRWSARVLRSLSGRPTLAKPDQWRRYPYPFVYGTYDPQLFPTEDFRECCARSLARSQVPHWTPDFETDDVPDLVEQIRTAPVPEARRVPDEGRDPGHGRRAARLLPARRGAVRRVDPARPRGARPSACAQQLLAARAAPVAVAVDAEGLVVDDLPALDYLFVTPSHQSPTTATLSLERRHRLLRRRRAHDFVVIEDDYEAENLYEGAPMPALKSLDKSGRVIYVGSVSKSLSPVLRLGYIVAPRAADPRAAPAAPRDGAPSERVPAARLCAVPLARPPRVARAQGQRGDAGAPRARRAALREHLPDFEFELPQGGGIDLGARPGLGRCRRAVAAGARPWRADRGRRRVLRCKPPYPCPYFRLRLSSIAAARSRPASGRSALAVDELAQARGEAARRGIASRAHVAADRPARLRESPEALAPSRRARWPFRRSAACGQSRAGQAGAALCCLPSGTKYQEFDDDN